MRAAFGWIGFGWALAVLAAEAIAFGFHLTAPWALIAGLICGFVGVTIGIQIWRHRGGTTHGR